MTMSDTIDAGDGRTYILDETLHPVGVEDDEQGVSRPPTPQELSQDFPHMSGADSGVYVASGNLVGVEDESQQMSVDMSQAAASSDE
jgi:hypothetical protein